MAFVDSTVFKAITSGAKFLETYTCNNWVGTTFKGAGNILSGVSQYFLGHAFKCSKNHEYRVVQSAKHIERGARVFKQGVYEFAPGAVGATLGYLGASRLWYYLDARR